MPKVWLCICWRLHTGCGLSNHMWKAIPSSFNFLIQPSEMFAAFLSLERAVKKCTIIFFFFLNEEILFNRWEFLLC